MKSPLIANTHFISPPLLGTGGAEGPVLDTIIALNPQMTIQHQLSILELDFPKLILPSDLNIRWFEFSREDLKMYTM